LRYGIGAYPGGDDR